MSAGLDQALLALLIALTALTNALIAYLHWRMSRNGGDK
jgi:hypothetical protein